MGAEGELVPLANQEFGLRVEEVIGDENRVFLAPFPALDFASFDLAKQDYTIDREVGLGSLFLVSPLKIQHVPLYLFDDLAVFFHQIESFVRQAQRCETLPVFGDKHQKNSRILGVELNLHHSLTVHET